MGTGSPALLPRQPIVGAKGNSTWTGIPAQKRSGSRKKRMKRQNLGNNRLRPRRTRSLDLSQLAASRRRRRHLHLRQRLIPQDHVVPMIRWLPTVAFMVYFGIIITGTGSFD